MKKIFLSLSIILSFSFLASAQTHLQFGLLSGSNSLRTLTPDDFSHNGWRVGVDQQFGKVIYLLGGVHYVRFNEEARQGNNFFDTDPAIQILKPRAGIGFTPLALTSLLKIRTKALASYNYFLAFEGETVMLESDRIKSGYLNLDIGVGATIGLVTVDIEYELGLNDVIEELSDSKYRFLSISAGLMF